jgi:hypothetical protein
MNFHKIWYLSVSQKYPQKIQDSLNLRRITGTLREDLCTFMIISRWILLRMRNVSDKSCRETQNTHFTFSNFFRKSCRLLDNVEKYGTARQATDGNIIRRMRFACWITKATNTHTEYVILIAFPRQQWLRERALILLFYVHCVSCYSKPGLCCFHYYSLLLITYRIITVIAPSRNRTKVRIT